MAKTCDSTWSCSNFWLPDTAIVPKDVHNQINALFLGNAMSLIAQVKVDGVPLPAPDGSQGGSKNSQSTGRPGALLFGLFLLVLLF
jgi:hypothetical protein